SDSAHDALFVGLVLVDGIAGGWLAQAASSPHPACCVVRQTECDLLGHHRAGTSLFVEPSAFSDVADQQRHDKSPALISGAPDRCAVLCSVVDKVQLSNAVQGSSITLLKPSNAILDLSNVILKPSIAILSFSNAILSFSNAIPKLSNAILRSSNAILRLSIALLRPSIAIPKPSNAVL